MKSNFKEKSTLLYLLIALGVILKLLKIEYLLGISIDFSSIIIFITLLLYGFKKSIIATIIMCGLDFLLRGSTSYQIIIFLEILVVGGYYSKNKLKSILLIDTIYWISLMGVVILFDFILSHIVGEFGYNYFSVLIVSINSLFNVLIAEILYVSIVHKAFNGQKMMLALKDIIFYLLFATILIPFIINVLLDVKSSYEYICDAAETSAQEIHDNLEDELTTWNSKRLLNLKLNGTIETGILKDIVSNISKHKKSNVIIENSRGGNIINIVNYEEGIGEYDTYDRRNVSEKVYELLPKGRYNFDYNLRWMDGYFVYESQLEGVNLNVKVEVPFKIYKDRIEAEYISQIKFLILFCLSVFILGRLLKKAIVTDMNLICENSENVVGILQENLEVTWPKSSINEIESLSGNIKNMIVRLKESFYEINETQSQLYKLAYFDMLTELPNRVFFKEYLKGCTKDENSKFAVMFIDLNKFKSINDTMGHDTGDKLLAQVGGRLQLLQSESYKVFRLGGDEFVIVAFIKSKDEIEEIGNRTLKVFQEEFRIKNDIGIKITGSIGVSIYPDDSRDVDILTKYADMAMYDAKSNSSGNIQIFTTKLKQDFYEKADIEKEIRYAIENNELRLRYQPKISSLTGKINSVEVLLRWTNLKLGEVSPSKFIPIAEESEIILDIDKWVILEAIKANKRLQEEGYKKIPLSVNISAKNFLNFDIAEYISDSLKAVGLEAKYLTIEITEGTLIANVDMVIKVVNRLKALGVRVSMDDLGKGYSSLSVLTYLPIDEVKIDMEFVKGISKNKKKQKVVSLIVELAHELKFNVVAEGVETEEEKVFLENINCDELQGYYFSKPIENEKLKELLEEKGGWI